MKKKKLELRRGFHAAVSRLNQRGTSRSRCSPRTLHYPPRPGTAATGARCDAAGMRGKGTAAWHEHGWAGQGRIAILAIRPMGPEWSRVQHDTGGACDLCGLDWAGAAGVAETGRFSASPHSLIDLNPTFSRGQANAAGAMHAVSSGGALHGTCQRAPTPATPPENLTPVSLSAAHQCSPSARKHHDSALASCHADIYPRLCARQLAPDQALVRSEPASPLSYRIANREDPPPPAALLSHESRHDWKKPHCNRCTACRPCCTHRKWPKRPSPQPRCSLVAHAERALGRGVGGGVA